MTKLLIDIGNTCAKIAVSQDGVIVHFERLIESWQDVFSRLYRIFSIDKIVVSIVGEADEQFEEILSKSSCCVARIGFDTPCPHKDIKGIPAGYGADRLAADFGAFAQDAVNPIMVIDAGTCITYDIFDADGTLTGGIISPGVQLRLQAMHDHTALLPLLKATSTSLFSGTKTTDCLLAGAVHGARLEVIGFIHEVSRIYPDIHVFITGGNDFSIPDYMECRVTHDPYLVLKGLDSV